jgi:hypothetical protein
MRRLAGLYHIHTAATEQELLRAVAQIQRMMAGTQEGILAADILGEIADAVSIEDTLIKLNRKGKRKWNY